MERVCTCKTWEQKVKGVLSDKFIFCPFCGKDLQEQILGCGSKDCVLEKPKKGTGSDKPCTCFKGLSKERTKRIATYVELKSSLNKKMESRIRYLERKVKKLDPNSPTKEEPEVTTEMLYEHIMDCIEKKIGYSITSMAEHFNTSKSKIQRAYKNLPADLRTYKKPHPPRKKAKKRFEVPNAPIEN